jgi:hypothetical protein
MPIYQCSCLIYAFAISSKARDMGNNQTHVVALRCHFVVVLIVAQQHDKFKHIPLVNPIMQSTWIVH